MVTFRKQTNKTNSKNSIKGENIMGQYYNILMKEENKNTVVYNRDLIVNGKKEYTFAKLMEHSWWLNPMVNAITEKEVTAILRHIVKQINCLKIRFIKILQLLLLNS